jgi:adenine-specific DNA-methyltransferase
MILDMTVGKRKPLDEMSREELLDLARSEHEEGIRISFSGKDVARRLARRVQPRAMRRLAKYSFGSEEEQASNEVIEGENLQAMVTLYRDRGQVDLILTDPPYNTGRDFRYNDRWDDDPNDPGLGDLVSEDDGDRHTKWMKFMWPRLKVMRDMLKPTGVLAICIDHRELFRLGQMLDELFREENRVAIINWQKSATRRNDQQNVSTATEYVLVYAKDRDRAHTGLLERPEELDAGYRNQDGDPDGDWLGVAPWGPSRATHMGMVYGVQSPFTGELHYPPGSRCWGFEKPSIKSWLEEWGSRYEERDLDDGFVPALVLQGAKDPRSLTDVMEDPVVRRARRRAQKIRAAHVWPQLFFSKGGDGKPRKKTSLEKVKKGVVPDTFWADDEYFEPVDIGCVSWDAAESGTSEAGARELSAVVGDDHGFDTVKPLKLFTKIIQLWCPPDGLVLDPFAGSGTTGHAVLALNARSASTRRFTLVEQGRPERGDPYARSLLAERLRRVIHGDWMNDKGRPLGGGYRFVQLQKTVDAEALLAMERDDMTDAVIGSHYDVNRRGGPGLIHMTADGHAYLVARNLSDEGFYLVWDGSPEPPAFTDEVYDSVVSEAIKARLKPMYHVYARFNLFQSDDVRFYQIPDQILLDFGVDINGAFNNESDAE